MMSKDKNGDKTAFVSSSSKDDPNSSPTKARGKRAQLQRKPELEKVDESDFEPSSGEEKSTETGCPDYFGVKSYLHNFYEYTGMNKADMGYDEDDEDEYYQYLLHPNKKRKRCNPVWWKMFVWIGGNFLVFGIIIMLVGYLVPRKPVVFANNERYSVVDSEAQHYNYVLETCKLIGLIMFCGGGLILCIALLFPSFLHKCFEDRKKEESETVMMPDDSISTGDTVPATPVVSEVQPQRRDSESIVTNEGIVQYN